MCCKYLIDQCSTLPDDSARRPFIFFVFLCENPWCANTAISLKVFFFFGTQHKLDLLTVSLLWNKASQTSWEGKRCCVVCSSLKPCYRISLKFLIFQQRHLELALVPCAAFCWVFGAFTLCFHPLLLIKRGLLECCFPPLCFYDLSSHRWKATVAAGVHQRKKKRSFL